MPNLIDYKSFQACITGPNSGPVSPGCSCFDFNDDDDVDLTAWRLFQQVFTLPAPIIAGFIVEAYGIVPVFYCSSALLFLAATVWVFISIPRVEE